MLKPKEIESIWNLRKLALEVAQMLEKNTNFKSCNECPDYYECNHR